MLLPYLLRSAIRVDRAFVRDEAGKAKHLPGYKTAFFSAIVLFDNIAHFSKCQFHVVKVHVWFERSGIEEHFCCIGDGDR